MDRILPPDPTRPSVVYAVVAPRHARGRSLIAGACVLGAMYLAFVVGAPWLLREAPPDTYVVVATKAACPAPADVRSNCGSAHP